MANILDLLNDFLKRERVEGDTFRKAEDLMIMLESNGYTFISPRDELYSAARGLSKVIRENGGLDGIDQNHEAVRGLVSAMEANAK